MADEKKVLEKGKGFFGEFKRTEILSSKEIKDKLLLLLSSLI